MRYTNLNYIPNKFILNKSQNNQVHGFTFHNEYDAVLRTETEVEYRDLMIRTVFVLDVESF